MRKALVDALLKHKDDDRFIFLTGDLGYGCVEPLQAALGERFINCGIAEANMVSVSAGLAKEGMRPFVYSIAPFLYARAFEQIRNDICFHDMPVCLVGNGGGFGYGINGPTHHALEDYGVLLTLPHIKITVPAFDADVEEIVNDHMIFGCPTYLRLGLSEAVVPEWSQPYWKWRRLTIGEGPTVLSIGPIAGGMIEPFNSLPDAERPSLWAASELPLREIPTAFRYDVGLSGRLIVIEEHVQHGGLWSCLANAEHWMTSKVDVKHIFAQSPPYRAYGSQKFHRKKCGLDIESIMEVVNGYS